MAITLTSSSLMTSENNKTYILQAGKDATVSLLKQSAKIISDRLKVYGLTSFDLNVTEDKRQIKIQLLDNLDFSEIEGLLSSKGELAFYETLTLSEIADLLKSDSKFNPGDGRIGCSTFEDHNMVTKVEEYLKTNNLLSSCKLFWSLKNSKSLTCLYALKISIEGKPLLIRSDVEIIKSSQNKDSNDYKLEIKFVPAVRKIWADATKNNINKPIAIVVDDKIFYTPIIRTAMEGGVCEITGDFTQKEVNYFLALVNNENLPLSLSLIK